MNSFSFLDCKVLEKDKQNIIVDFSGPNVAKQMHVGHLRSTVIGNSIVNILKKQGHTTHSINHIGDWGTQFGMLIAGYKDPIVMSGFKKIKSLQDLNNLYKHVAKKFKEDAIFASKAKLELKKLQDGYIPNIKIWNKFCKITKLNNDKLYKAFSIAFDFNQGESYYNNYLQPTVQQLLNCNIAKESDNAVCVFFDNKDLKSHPFLIQKSDGAYLYSTTDLCAAKVRNEKYNKAIYVTDYRQELHFKQLKETCKQMNLQIQIEHAMFGSVTDTNGQPLKSRDGDPVALQYLLDEAILKSKSLSLKGNSSYKQVAIGALIYADLMKNRTSNYVFDIDKMISLSGNSGPYIQYTYSRFFKMLNAFGEGDCFVIETEAEKKLALFILDYKDALSKAASNLHPHVLTDYIFGLCKSASHFYESCIIKNQSDEKKNSSMFLIKAFCIIHKEVMECLGMPIVTEM